jgi:2-(1,2-epoxy-1,2-dihydrophenyl)acetyl-CoA isomerase
VPVVTDVLIIERDAGVATVRLNRPESLNSLKKTIRRELLAALTELATDQSARAIVLTGTGRGFCVGQDLAEHNANLEAGRPGLRSVVSDEYNPITLALATMPKPVIAAVNGPAAGAGAGLAFACDFRIASRSASFLIAFARIGLTLDTGVSWTLPRLIGAARATALSLLADPVTADSALEMGLVNAVVAPDELAAAAHELAARLASGPTAAYAAIKQSLAYAAQASLPETLAREAELQAAMGESADHLNATTAFLAKQPPTFVGH